MSNDKKESGNTPRPMVLPDGTVFTAYGVSKAPPPITPVSGRGASPSERRKPATTPDWGFWLHMPSVKLWQAVALSMNVDPDSLKHHPQAWMAGPGAAPIFTEDSYPSRQERDRADKRLRLLAANKTRENGFSPSILSMDNPANHGVRLSEFAAWAVEIVKWPDLPPELVALARKQVDVPERNDAAVSADNGAPVKVGVGNTATGKAAQPKQETGEPFLQPKSRNSRAEVDQWVKWQAHQKVMATDNTSDLAERILAIADSWQYQSERGPMTIASITKMLPTGLTGGRAKNKGIRGKNQKT